MLATSPRGELPRKHANVSQCATKKYVMARNVIIGERTEMPGLWAGLGERALDSEPGRQRLELSKDLR